MNILVIKGMVLKDGYNYFGHGLPLRKNHTTFMEKMQELSNFNFKSIIHNLNNLHGNCKNRI